METYLDVREFIHTTAGGDRVKVLFPILNGHSNVYKLPVNVRFAQSPIVAYRANRCTIRDSLRGAHLLAHTSASKPKQHGVFSTCSLIKNAPSHGNLRHYTMRGDQKSRCKPKVC